MKMTMTLTTILIIAYLQCWSGEEEGQVFLFDLIHVMRAFVVDLDPDLLLLLLDHLITL